MEELCTSVICVIINYLSTSNVETVALVATSAIAICAIVARELDAPKPESSKWYRITYLFINKLAMNSKKAQNKGA